MRVHQTFAKDLGGDTILREHPAIQLLREFSSNVETPAASESAGSFDAALGVRGIAL
jgi:hypothetical protein